MNWMAVVGLLASPLYLLPGIAAAPPRVRVPAPVSPPARHAPHPGPAPAAEVHHVVVALALRDRDALDDFLRDVRDPTSPRYHRFLTPAEFDARHAPTAAD